MGYVPPAPKPVKPVSEKRKRALEMRVVHLHGDCSHARFILADEALSEDVAFTLLQKSDELSLLPQNG